METKEICHEGKDKAEDDIDQGDEYWEKIIIEADNCLPVEDVEILDELSCCDLDDHDDECYPAIEQNKVANWHWQRWEAEHQKVGDPGGQANGYFHATQVGQELVNKGAVGKVSTEALIPDDTVEQQGANKNDDNI